MLLLLLLSQFPRRRRLRFRLCRQFPRHHRRRRRRLLFRRDGDEKRRREVGDDVAAFVHRILDHLVIVVFAADILQFVMLEKSATRRFSRFSWATTAGFCR